MDPVISDKMLLRRVFLNLLDNGVKFTPDRGSLTVSITRYEHLMTILVQDSGPGMDSSQHAKIFQRFWQTRHGRNHGIGSGLGLFISKEIMETLGGSIECESTPGVGTKFSINLPIESCDNLQGNADQSRVD